MKLDVDMFQIGWAIPHRIRSPFNFRYAHLIFKRSTQSPIELNFIDKVEPDARKNEHNN